MDGERSKINCPLQVSSSHVSSGSSSLSSTKESKVNRRERREREMRTCFFSFSDSFVFEPLERSLRCCQLIAKVWKGQINKNRMNGLIFEVSVSGWLLRMQLQEEIVERKLTIWRMMKVFDHRLDCSWGEKRR